MVATGLGPVPLPLAEAATMVADTVELAHIPDTRPSVAITGGWLRDIHLDAGPRSWRLSSRPQQATRQLWDAVARELDLLESLWTAAPRQIKVQLTGPLSLSASVELSSGHLALSDSAARRDIAEAVAHAAEDYRQEVSRRWQASVVVQLSEPLLPKILAGDIAGTSDFDPIAPLPLERAVEELSWVEPDWVATPTPVWQLPGQLLTPLSGLHHNADLDALAAVLDSGASITALCPLGPEADPGQQLQQLVALIDQLGLAHSVLREQVDIAPWPVTASTASGAYLKAGTLAQLLAEVD